MKRLGRRLALFLGLGVICTVVVSWGSAVWWGRPEFDPRYTAQVRQQRWEAEEQVPRLVAEEMWIESAWHGRGLEVLIIRRPDKAARRTCLYRSGWPLPALEGRVRWRDNIGSKETQTSLAAFALPIDLNLEVSFHKRIVLTETVPRVLPLQPVLLGALADTAFYSAAAVLADGVRRIALHWIRRRRGRCPACGYDLRGFFASGCSECGWGRARHERGGRR